jgi:hypothetical protein
MDNTLWRGGCEAGVIGVDGARCNNIIHGIVWSTVESREWDLINDGRMQAMR